MRTARGGADDTGVRRGKIRVGTRKKSAFKPCAISHETRTSLRSARIPCDLAQRLNALFLRVPTLIFPRHTPVRRYYSKGAEKGLVSTAAMAAEAKKPRRGWLVQRLW